MRGRRHFLSLLSGDFILLFLEQLHDVLSVQVEHEVVAKVGFVPGRLRPHIFLLLPCKFFLNLKFGELHCLLVLALLALVALGNGFLAVLVMATVQVRGFSHRRRQLVAWLALMLVSSLCIAFSRLSFFQHSFDHGRGLRS